MPLTHKLFAAHMAQHVLLLAVAPPLVVLSAPGRGCGSRFRARSRIRSSRGRSSTRPWSCGTSRRCTTSSLRSGALHVFEHCLFFGTGLLFWGAAFDSARLASWWRIAYLTTGMLVGWLIALVLAFATSPLYSAYAALPHRPWGLSELADQQIAAGVMWVPGSLAYTVAIIVFVYRWLEPESSARRLGLAGGG